MTSKLKFVLALSLLSLALSAITYAQQPATASAASPEVQLLRAVLEEQRALREEVRQLRATMQRISVNAYRAQVLNDRLARQQTRVDIVTEEIEQLKTQMQQLLDTSRDADELVELKAAIDTTPDPQTRGQLIQAYQSTERSQVRQRELAQQEAERSRVRQQQLETNLRMEQAKLSDLKEQLDALDREFERPLSETRKPR